jgi:hypothetical protein
VIVGVEEARRRQRALLQRAWTTSTWFKDAPAAGSLTESLIAYVTSAVPEKRQARAITRHLERVGDRISSELESYFTAEFKGLGSNERAAALQGLIDALLSASFGYTSLEATNFDEGELARLLTERRQGLGLSEAGERFFDLLARECAAYVVSATLAMPDFTSRIGVTILRREAEAFAAVDDALTRLPKRVATEISGEADQREADRSLGFELEYRRLLARRLDQLTLYGLESPDIIGRTYRLSVAYVSLNVRDRSPAVSGRSVFRVEDALADAIESLIVISGEAGSGKTTILQWLAVQCARRDFGPKLDDWNTRVPFFLQLRAYTGDRRLPRPAEFLDTSAELLAERMPSGWVAARLDVGRALVLIDGLDELSEERRRDVNRWLNELHLTYPRAMCILSSRPAAVSMLRFDDLRFRHLSVEAMDGPDVLAFIDHWHRAASRAVAGPRCSVHLL